MLFDESSPFACGQVDFSVTPADRTVIQRLAHQVAELAARPLEDEKRDLWRRHNALLATRPLVFCDPENGWHEIFPAESLDCEGELARMWEFALRKEIFWGAEMRDDRVIQATFDVAHVYTTSGWGLDVAFVGGAHGSAEGGAYKWDSPLKSAQDLGALHAPHIEVDEAATARLLDLAHDLLDGILSVRLRTQWWWSMGLTWNLAALRGLGEFMYDMIDQPDLIHGAMRILHDGTLSVLESLQRRDLLSPNHDGAYVGSGGFGWSDELPQPDFAGKIRPCDMWGFAESQETVGISPEMFEEFVFPYQSSLLDHFGLNCYGCCEPLDKRWYIVERFPRLRRVSVSPWANRAFMAEMLGNRYVYSMKPNPADVAMPEFDEEGIRTSLRSDLCATRDCRVEVIMKDNHTIAHDPQRVVRWVQIAKEEAGAL